MSFIVRRVEPDDYKNIVDMREDIYHGTDYIPDTFQKLVKHPDYKGYVAVDNDRFAAFVFTLTVDGGMTVVSRASRVREDYEGKGIYKKFDEKVKKLSVGSAKVYALTFHEENGSLIRQMNNGQATPVMQREVFHFKISSNKLQDFDFPSVSLERVRQVTSTDLQVLFSNPDVRKSLFPEKRIVCHWIPFRILDENIPLIMFHSTNIIGSFSPHCTLLTTSHPVKATLGLACHITIYGTNLGSLREHLQYHIRQCYDMAKGDEIHIWIHDTGEWENAIVNIMTDCGFKQQFSLPMKKFYCVEKSIV